MSKAENIAVAHYLGAGGSHLILIPAQGRREIEIQLIVFLPVNRLAGGRRPCLRHRRRSWHPRRVRDPRRFRRRRRWLRRRVRLGTHRPRVTAKQTLSVSAKKVYVGPNGL